MDTPLAQRQELGAFLRARRERLSPADVDLVPGGRRRTPGLRREEVAQLANVGVTWYTWLEQARDIKASPEVLDAICRALRMDASERAHVFALAGSVDATYGHRTCVGLSDGFADVLDQLDPYPAAAFTWRYDIVGYNKAFRFLAADLDEIPQAERNQLWLTFTHPAWQRLHDNHDAVTATMVSKFRAMMAHHMQDPLGQELVRRLQAASPRFCELWDAHDVTSPDWPVKVFHSRVGKLSVRPHKLALQAREGTGWISIYSPADDITARRLPELMLLDQQTQLSPA